MEVEQNEIKEDIIVDVQESKEEHERGEESDVQGKHCFAQISRTFWGVKLQALSESSLMITSNMIVLQMTNTSGNFMMNIIKNQQPYKTTAEELRKMDQDGHL